MVKDSRYGVLRFKPQYILRDSGAVNGVGKSLNGGGKHLGKEKSRMREKVIDFSSPEFFSHVFRLFPAPTSWP